jgi:hypothetical protein
VEAQTMQKLLQKQSADPILLKLLYLAFTEWRTIKEPRRPTFIPPPYHHLFKLQSEIGWNQVIAGRMCTTWSEIHDNNPATSSNGDAWMISAIRIMWTCLYSAWKHRCTTKHGTDATTRREQALLRLRPEVEELYKEYDNLEHLDRRILNKPIAELLQLPTNIIENWIFKAKPNIKASLARAKRNREKQHLPIYKLFQSINTNKKSNDTLELRYKRATATAPINEPTPKDSRALQTAASKPQRANINTIKDLRPPTKQNHAMKSFKKVITRAKQTAAITSTQTRYISQIMTTYFTKKEKPAEPEPVIPEPKSDDRPP